jgi:hypothetical protein
VRLEALRIAWHDRLRLLGDPDHVEVPVEKLLSKRYAEQSADRVRAAVKAKKPVEGSGDGREAGGTVHLTAVDTNVLFVALTLTLRLSAGASSPVKAPKQAADGGETCELFWVLAVGCTRLIRDRRGRFVQTAEEDAEDDSAPRPSSSSSAAPAAERKCPACEQALVLRPEAVCVKDDCSFGAFHAHVVV